MPLKREQLAVIHIAKKELKLDDDLYRTLLQDVAGVSSSKDLDSESFDRLMKRFQRLGLNKPNPRSRKDGQALVLPTQLAFIEKLYQQLSWEEAERRTGFNQRQIGKPWPQTRSEANKVVEGLKMMIRRQKKNNA